MTLNIFSDAASLSQFANKSQELGKENSPRSEKELFHTPRPQIVSAGVTRYTLQMGDWRIPIVIPLKNIQQLYNKITAYNWQLINGMPADSARILASADRFVAAGGVK